MNDFKEAVKDYLGLRRGLGFKLKKHTRFLEEFASFLQRTDESMITSRLALQWATEPQHIKPCEWAARLSAVRSFARYLSAFDPRTEIPPQGLLPYRTQRAKPYIYSDEQIRQLLEAAQKMPATHSLQPWTYHCLFGLLAVTGLRISEALNLRRHRCRLDRRHSYDPALQVWQVTTDPASRIEHQDPFRVWRPPGSAVHSSEVAVLLLFPF